MSLKKNAFIDVHHHMVPNWYREILLQNAPHMAFLPPWNAEQDLALMERQGIATTMLSMTFAPSGTVTRRLNEDLAALVHQYPQQYGALGVLPLPDIQAATSEAVYALDVLKLDGIALLSNYQGFYLSDEGSDELLSELNQRSAVVFLHPVDPPDGSHGMVSALYEFPLETTRAISLLLVRGKLKQYPQIRWILAHAGGTLPYVAHRLSVVLATLQSAHLGIADPAIVQSVREEIRHLYYDTAISGNAWPLSLLQQVTSTSHILFGTDATAASEAHIAENTQELFAYAGFSSEEQRSIASENAQALFPRLQSQGSPG